MAEARRLIHLGVRGFKLHPPLQQFHPNDRIAYPFYEVINEARLPVIFHTGHSGIGTGMPGGGGVRLKYGNPMDIDDVAVDFPDMPIIMAHPSFPWQDEAISICLHKPQVYIDLSGWSPKYFSPILIQYANTLLKHKMLFGSDYPAHHSRSLDGGLREDRHPRRGAAPHFERECGSSSQASQLTTPVSLAKLGSRRPIGHRFGERLIRFLYGQQNRGLGARHSAGAHGGTERGCAEMIRHLRN